MFLAATSGDNTNLVIAQIAQRRFNVPRVVVRVADPGRAAWYAEQGLLDDLPDPGRDRPGRADRCSRGEGGSAACT